MKRLCCDCVGLYVAAHDQGSCTTIISLALYYYACRAVVDNLVAYRLTPAGRHLTDLLPVEGRCVSHAHLATPTAAAATPTRLCTSTGSWYSGSSESAQCQCDAGYQPSHAHTRCVFTAGALAHFQHGLMLQQWRRPLPLRYPSFYPFHWLPSPP